MWSAIGPIGLALIVVVGALWTYSLVIAVLKKAAEIDKDVSVIVRFLPWPRVEISVKCAEKATIDQADSDGRALEHNVGEATI